MKLFLRLVRTFFISIILLSLVAIGFYLNRDKFYISSTESQLAAQFENRKKEVLQLISQNYIGDDINSKDLDTAQLKGIVASLSDPYSTYFSNSEYNDFQNNLDEKYEGIGIGFNQSAQGFIVTKILSNSPAEKEGIQVNDIITKVDDKDLKNIDFDKIGDLIRGKANTTVKISILRNGVNIDFNVIRAAISNDLVTLTLKGDVGVISISSFGTEVSKKFGEIAQKILDNKDIKYLVLDLRSNTGGLLNETVEIASYLQKPNEVIVLEKDKNKEIKLTTSQKNISLESYPIIVITDKYTASASEILAGSLRDNRGTKLIGQKTFGKGVVQKLFQLNSGDTLKLTIAEWLTPKGSVINKLGLSPDIKTPETDDTLQKAIDTVKSN